MLNGTYLVEIYFYFSVRNHIPYKFPRPYSEGTFFGIEAQLILSKYLKCLFQIFYVPLVL